MNEWTIGWLATARLLLVVAFATLYWIGGRRNKWIRRIAGGLLISVGTIGFAVALGTFSPWHLLAIAAYPGALTLGYGGSATPVKLRRRLMFGTAVGASAFIFAVPTWISTSGLAMRLRYQPGCSGAPPLEATTK